MFTGYLLTKKITQLLRNFPQICKTILRLLYRTVRTDYSTILQQFVPIGGGLSKQGPDNEARLAENLIVQYNNA